MTNGSVLRVFFSFFRVNLVQNQPHAQKVGALPCLVNVCTVFPAIFALLFLSCGSFAYSTILGGRVLLVAEEQAA